MPKIQKLLGDDTCTHCPPGVTRRTDSFRRLVLLHP
jgi:hypothetical protein